MAIEHSSFERLETHYISSFGKNLEDILSFYASFFIDDRFNDEIKAEVALIGGHQSRLNDVRKQRKYAQEAIRTLAKAKLWTKKFTSFEELYVVVKETIGPLPYVGDLAIYDVSVRISACMSIRPEFVYLTAGALQGAKVLLGVKKISIKSDVKIFTKYFSHLSAIHIENVLCIYKTFYIKGGIKKNAKFPSHNPNLTAGLRRNMLAYQIFIEEKISVTSTIMSVSFE